MRTAASSRILCDTTIQAFAGPAKLFSRQDAAFAKERRQEELGYAPRLILVFLGVVLAFLLVLSEAKDRLGA